MHRSSRLFYNFLLIISIPIVLLQAITVAIFYHRHWQHISDQMQQELVNQIHWVVREAEGGKNKKALVKEAQTIFGLGVYFYPSARSKEEQVDTTQDYQQIKKMREKLELLMPKKAISAYYINDKKHLRIVMVLKDHRLIRIDAKSESIRSITTHIFLWWVLGSAILVLVVALILARNQLSGVLRLAIALQKFNRGEMVDTFSPSGTPEIQEAGMAFVKMKSDLEANIQEKKKFLMQIAHDMRTPLTRMKLQLALMKEGKQLRILHSNLDEMDLLLTNYIQFAKDNQPEEYLRSDLQKFVYEIVKSADDNRIMIQIDRKNLGVGQKFISELQVNAFKRAINNILQNAIKFGREKIVVTLKKDKKTYNIIEIEDDGPGMETRTKAPGKGGLLELGGQNNSCVEGGGFGIGLTIAEDIIKDNNGVLEMGSSQMGGLKVIVKCLVVDL